MTDFDKCFVSRTLAKIFFKNGFGLFILNAHKFNIIPRFYGVFRKEFFEVGFYFTFYNFHIMWNKHFAVNNK